MTTKTEPQIIARLRELVPNQGSVIGLSQETGLCHLQAMGARTGNTLLALWDMLHDEGIESDMTRIVMEGIRHGDLDHQRWLESHLRLHMDSAVNDIRNRAAEVLGG